jgi:hypothetical protein
MRRDRDDVAMLIRSFAERLSQNGDVPCEASFFYNGVGPHPLQQLFLRDHAVAMLDQREKCFQHLWRQRYGVAVT